MKEVLAAILAKFKNWRYFTPQLVKTKKSPLTEVLEAILAKVKERKNCRYFLLQLRKHEIALTLPSVTNDSNTAWALANVVSQLAKRSPESNEVETWIDQIGSVYFQRMSVGDPELELTGAEFFIDEAILKIWPFRSVKQHECCSKIIQRDFDATDITSILVWMTHCLQVAEVCPKFIDSIISRLEAKAKVVAPSKFARHRIEAKLPDKSSISMHGDEAGFFDLVAMICELIATRPDLKPKAIEIGEAMIEGLALTNPQVLREKLREF